MVSSGVYIAMRQSRSHILLFSHCSQECEKCRAADLDSGQGITFTSMKRDCVYTGNNIEL